MRSEDHQRILGPALLAEIRRRAAAAPPPSLELIELQLRPVLAPAMARIRAHAAQAEQHAA
jgi:hypothetical protein